MAQHLRTATLIGFCLLPLACGQASNEANYLSSIDSFQFEESAKDCKATTIEQRLSCIEGVTFQEVKLANTPAEYRTFDVQIEQPVDHANPKGEKFKQRLVLFHTSETAPLVLQTSGYEIFSVGLTRLAKDLGANQIQVEHRYFKNSKPENLDWSKLTIEQSAADFHNIVLKFKSTYPKGWVNTGASKGGMTSIYHRRFYPNDLAATVALVAPHSYNTQDDRYIPFVEQVGGEKYAQCRADLEKYQQALLKNKATLIPGLKGTYNRIGSAAIAYEHAVVELPFTFWQYGNPASKDQGCGAIPGDDATPGELFSFMARVNNAEEYFGDAGLTPFVPYFYQAAAQLGGPGAKLSHIEPLMDHKDTYQINTYLPAEAKVQHDGGVAMRAVQQWIDNESERIIMIYGEFDPWTAGAYAPRRGAGDNKFYTVKGGNHGANHTLLSTAERKEALEKLGEWLDVKVDTENFAAQDAKGAVTEDLINLPSKSKVRYLEEIEADIRRQRRL